MLQIFRGKCPQPTQTRIKLLVEYENKNCNNIFSENFKRIKETKFQEHLCVIGLEKQSHKGVFRTLSNIYDGAFLQK